MLISYARKEIRFLLSHELAVNFILFNLVCDNFTILNNDVVVPVIRQPSEYGHFMTFQI